MKTFFCFPILICRKYRTLHSVFFGNNTEHNDSELSGLTSSFILDTSLEFFFGMADVTGEDVYAVLECK